MRPGSSRTVSTQLRLLSVSGGLPCRRGKGGSAGRSWEHPQRRHTILVSSSRRPASHRSHPKLFVSRQCSPGLKWCKNYAELGGSRQGGRAGEALRGVGEGGILDWGNAEKTP